MAIQGFSKQILQDFPSSGIFQIVGSLHTFCHLLFAFQAWICIDPRSERRKLRDEIVDQPKNAEGSMLGMKMMKALLGWLTYF